MNEWISVKDQTPPQDGSQFLGYSPENEEAPIYVLVYDPGKKYTGDLARCSYEANYREASGENYFTWKPIYWMPLPAPPRGEINE